MPSPFPGMDPYLEDPSRRADFHPTFIVALRRRLSRLVSPNFRVDIQEYVIEEPLPATGLKHRYLEIRDARTREVVAVIEVLSPGNKARGSSLRENFLRKREAVMNSSAHWLEIDLLRSGERPADVRRPSDYYALLRRAEEDHLEVWYFDLRDALPVIAVPLRPPFPDAPLALQSVFEETYADGFYGDKLDYTAPVPAPRPRPADSAWVESQIAARAGS